jgi:hypothetical protein
MRSVVGSVWTDKLTRSREGKKRGRREENLQALAYFNERKVGRMRFWNSWSASKLDMMSIRLKCHRWGSATGLNVPPKKVLSVPREFTSL